MENFKCPVCGHIVAEVLNRVFKDSSNKLQAVMMEDIFQIKNFISNRIIILRACAKCHIIKADWEEITQSDRCSMNEKEKVKEVQKQYVKNGR